jgi:hypothetical protein
MPKATRKSAPSVPSVPVKRPALAQPLRFSAVLLSPFRRLESLLRGGAKPASRPSKQAKSAVLKGLGQKRTLAQWKESRRRITAEVKAHLAEQQPLPAIKKLTRALLEDPQHPAYHELLKKAVEQRRQRRLKAGRKDAWAELPREMRQEALQLEAFTVFVDELEQLFDQAGIPPLSAPPPPDQLQTPRRRANAAQDSPEPPA